MFFHKENLQKPKLQQNVGLNACVQTILSCPTAILSSRDGVFAKQVARSHVFETTIACSTNTADVVHYENCTTPYIRRVGANSHPSLSARKQEYTECKITTSAKQMVMIK